MPWDAPIALLRRRHMATSPHCRHGIFIICTSLSEYEREALLISRRRHYTNNVEDEVH
jgi:hypothetical protein